MHILTICLLVLCVMAGLFVIWACWQANRSAIARSREVFLAQLYPS